LWPAVCSLASATVIESSGMPTETVLAIATDVAPLALVRVPAGEYQMGTTNDYFSETPRHQVVIGADFLLGKYPVTQEQWQAVMGGNPSAFRDSLANPVDSVSWDQAAAFCDRLTAQCRRRVRLPSEAEWEYSCRAGTLGEYFSGPWGPFLDPSEVPREVWQTLYDYAWFNLNSGERTHPVGLKRPNPWGLHDMIGNVWEWCADVWHDNYSGAPHDGGARLEGELDQPRRCLRGAAWDMDAQGQRPLTSSPRQGLQ
jgi:formylglycine-generating enzyme required for sulfatase activity